MMGWGDMGQRCTAILMLGTVVLTGCGTEPGPRIPPRMLDSAMGVPAAEWELLVAEYLRPETAAVRRFEIRNRLGLDLLDQIEDSFRIDQQNNAAARHKALAPARVNVHARTQCTAISRARVSAGAGGLARRRSEQTHVRGRARR